MAKNASKAKKALGGVRAEGPGDSRALDPTRRPIGRPVKFVGKMMEDYLAALALSGLKTHSAAHVGISYDVINDHENKGRRDLSTGNVESPYAIFAMRQEKAIAASILVRIQRINRAGADGSWQADAWFLERRHPDMFALQHRIRAHVTGESRVVFGHDVADYTDEELAEIESLLSRAERRKRAAVDVESSPANGSGNGSEHGNGHDGNGAA